MTSALSRPVNHVAVINRSTLDDREVSLMVEGYRDEVARVARAWGLPVPGLAVYGRAHEQKIQEEAAIIFVDSANEPDALGYHTALGITRYGYVDLGMCRAYDEPVSRVFGHELAELVVDPDCDRWAGPYADGTHAAIEVADPVQRNSRTFHVKSDLYGEGDVEIADWVLPDYFQPGSTGPWSDQGSVTAPLQVADGGYQVRERNGVVVAEDAQRVKSFGRTFRRLTQRSERLPTAPAGQRALT